MGSACLSSSPHMLRHAEKVMLIHKAIGSAPGHRAIVERRVGLRRFFISRYGEVIHFHGAPPRSWHSFSIDTSSLINDAAGIFHAMLSSISDERGCSHSSICGQRSGGFRMKKSCFELPFLFLSCFWSWSVPHQMPMRSSMTSRLQNRKNPTFVGCSFFRSMEDFNDGQLRTKWN